MTFGTSLRMGTWSTREPTIIIRELALSLPPTANLPGEGRGWRVQSITKGQWFKESRLCNGTSTRTQKARIQRASGLVDRQRCWESGVFRERGSSGPLPTCLALCISSIRLLLSHILLQQIGNLASKQFPEFCEPLQQINQTGRGGSWELPIHS